MRVAFGLVCGFMAFSLFADGPSERLKAIWEKREQWLAAVQARADKRVADHAAGTRRTEMRTAERRLAEINKELSRKPDPKKVSDLKQKLASPKWNAAMKARFKDDLKKEMTKKPNARRAAELKKEAKAVEAEIAESSNAEGAPGNADDVISAKRSDLSQWPPLEISGLSVGDVGRFPPFPVGAMSGSHRKRLEEICERMNRGEPPVTGASGPRFLDLFAPAAAIKHRHNIEIIQVLGDRAALASLHDLGNRGSLHAPTFWLRGIDTTNLTDDSTIAINDVVQVTGTESYETTSGRTKKVFVVEPFDVEQLRPFLPRNGPRVR